MSDKKSVLIITQLFPNSQFPTNGTFVLDSVLELKKYFNITVISPLPWFPRLKILKRIFPKWNKSSQIHYYEKINDIPVYHPRYFAFPKKILFLSKGFFYWLAIRKTTTQIIKKGKISLIHSYFAYPDGYAASLIAKKNGLPLITTVCGSDINANLSSKLITLFLKKGLSRTRKIIAISNDLNIKVNKLGVPSDKILLIPIGFNSSYFKPQDKQVTRKKLDLPQNKKIILFVGNLVTVKGIEYLIDAFGQVRKIMSNAFLIIVGKGDQKKYKDQLKSLNLSDSALLTGAIPHQKLNQWMTSADLLVLPSIQEGLGVVLIESMACGIPAVGSRVGGIPDIINSENGLLCTPKSINDLSEKIMYALEKKWDKQKITESVHRFRWDIIAREISALYENLIG